MGIRTSTTKSLRGRRSHASPQRAAPWPTEGFQYGMRKTTVYLTDELRHELTRAAAGTGRSEADLIREGIRLVVRSTTPPRPRYPLFSSGDPDFAHRTDEFLEGFGER